LAGPVHFFVGSYSSGVLLKVMRRCVSSSFIGGDKYRPVSWVGGLAAQTGRAIGLTSAGLSGLIALFFGKAVLSAMKKGETGTGK